MTFSLHSYARAVHFYSATCPVFSPPSTVFAVRLRHEYKPNRWRDAAIIPVLEITVSETGEVSYQVHEDAGG